MDDQIINNYKVCVRCYTFNHASYIVETLNGFTMQITNFPFICTVVDDASTDGEQNEIRIYLEQYFDLQDNTIVRNEETDDYVLIFARHKTNINCYFAVLFLKYNHYCIGKPKYEYIDEWHNHAKYTAICEGDDYWTDPYKLQKQVYYLETHPECGMCYSNFSKYNQKHGTFSHNCLKKEQIQKYNNLHDWIKLAPYAGPMTWMYRKDLISLKPSFNTVDGSFVTFAFFLAESKVHCLFEDNTAVYRVLDNSASQSRDITKQYKYKKGIHDIQLKLIEYYKSKLLDSNELITEINQKYYQRFLFHIIANGSQQELENAIFYSDKFWPFAKRLLARSAKYTLLSGIIKRLIKVYLNNNNKIKE